MVGGEGDGGSINSGLFGAVVVEPAGASWYRSQISAADLELVKVGTVATGQPKIDYERRYPTGHPLAGRPVLNMLDGTQIVHSDLTAIIAGSPPNAGGYRAGWFGNTVYPTTMPAITYIHPERHQPFREFVLVYHDEIGAVQAFPQFEDPVLSHTLHSGRDAFASRRVCGASGVHDVFEAGTPLDANGRPAAGSRALPDGEIAAGTPIPAVVPLPGKAMEPLPGATVSIASGQVQVTGAGNPGFPFFVPARAGHRPPHPLFRDAVGTGLDGGLWGILRVAN